MCGFVFNWKFRDNGVSAVSQALGRGARCPNCGSKDFRLNG